MLCTCEVVKEPNLIVHRIMNGGSDAGEALRPPLLFSTEIVFELRREKAALLLLNL